MLEQEEDSDKLRVVRQEKEIDLVRGDWITASCAIENEIYAFKMRSIKKCTGTVWRVESGVSALNSDYSLFKKDNIISPGIEDDKSNFHFKNVPSSLTHNILIKNLPNTQHVVHST